MNEPFVRGNDLVVPLLAGILSLLAPALSVGTLYVLYRASEHELDAHFLVLSALIVFLSGALLQPPRYNGSQIAIGRMPMALSILARWAVLLGVLLFVGYATKASSHFSRTIVLTWAVATPCLLVGATLLLQEMMRKLTTDVHTARRAIVAGCNEVSLSLCKRLKDNPGSGIHCLGFFDDRSLDRLGNNSGVRLLGRLPDLAAFVKQNRIDMIFIALPVRHVQRVMDLLDDLRDTTASIYYVPDIFVFDLIQARTGDFYGIPVVAMCETPFHGYRGVVKRLLDISVAFGVLLLLLPLMIAIAVAVRLSSPGPVIFRQRRYGLDGQEITVYKFRSMKVMEDGDRIVQAQKDDDRFTPIGRVLRRSSLDELPQLINVLQGRMSLVGPRPHAVAHNEEYRKLIKGYMVRHKVLPGITGLAQVNGCRGETARLEEMQARVDFDLDYLRRWSPSLDLQILGRTLLLLFKRDTKAY